MILTVSPIPLTATASEQHVLKASTASKSILRAVAWELEKNDPNIDYFPSYEILNNPKLHSTGFESNLRTARQEMIETAISHFLREHQKDFTANRQTHPKGIDSTLSSSQDYCEDALLDAFGK